MLMSKISICFRSVWPTAEAYEWFVFTARQKCLFMQFPQQQVINSKQRNMNVSCGKITVEWEPVKLLYGTAWYGISLSSGVK